MEGSRAAVVARHSRYAVCRRWRPGSRARCAPLGGRGLWGQEDGVLYRTIRHQISRSGMLFSCSVLYRATFSRHLFGQSQKRNSANFAVTEFSAPLCQAALHEGACISATRLLKTASEMRLLRHRNASLRDLPSAIFLR